MRNLWILSLALFLASCSVIDDATLPPLEFGIPGEWTGGKPPAGDVQAAWWTQFEDPVLDSLVREALENNQDIRMAAARIDSAEALARMAGADLEPHAGIGASGGRGRDALFGKSEKRDRYGLSLDLSWEIDLWGRVWAGEVAALKDYEAARAEHDAARLSVIAQTVKTWFAAAELREQVDLLEGTVGSYRSTLKVVKDRFTRGVAGSLDVRLASANLASAEALLRRYRELFDRVVRQLEALLGRYPEGALESRRELPAVPPEVPAGLPSELLMRRPDILAAENRVHASNARTHEAKASLLPRLSLTGSRGSVAGELSDLLSGSTAVWGLAASILQPIFEGGRLRANVDLRESQAREAVAAYAKVALNAFREVESALGSEQVLGEREEKLAEAVRHAASARRQAEENNRAGVGSFLLVLEAQRRELDARSRLLTVRRERLDNRVNLHLALGGGF